MHIFRHKFISVSFAFGSEKMSLKSDQLEVGGSVRIVLTETSNVNTFAQQPFIRNWTYLYACNVFYINLSMTELVY